MILYANWLQVQFVEVILVIVELCHVSCQSPLIGFLFTVNNAWCSSTILYKQMEGDRDNAFSVHELSGCYYVLRFIYPEMSS
jgi:hypothetical protein